MDVRPLRQMTLMPTSEYPPGRDRNCCIDDHPQSARSLRRNNRFILRSQPWALQSYRCNSESSVIRDAALESQETGLKSSTAAWTLYGFLPNTRPSIGKR